MKKLFILAILCHFLSTLLHAASVEAKVSASEVVEGNVVKLQISAEGDKVEFPRISEIAGEAVVGTSMQSSRNMAYVNGEMKSEKITTKVIGFVPQKDLTIPSYTVKIDGKSYQTEPISVKVVASKAPQLKADALYSFDLKSSKTEISAGESFVVTLYVSVSDRIQGAKLSNFTDPEMKDFYSKALGESRQYRQNGYTVVEKQYLLIANKDGNFTIGPAKAKLGKADLQRRDFFGRYVTQWYDIASNDLFIQVKPQPQKSDLIGEFRLSAKVDATEVKANKPVNLTVKIEGEGNLEDFEFPEYEIDGVTVYSDEAQVHSQVKEGKLYSFYTKSFAMISENDFTIPSRSFTIWNPKTSVLEKLEVSSYDIKVKGDKGALQATISTEESKREKAETGVRDIGHQQEVSAKDVYQITWWMLVAAFMAGMLALYIILKLLSSFQNSRKTYKNDEALQLLYPYINESEEVEKMVRKLYAKKNGEKSVEIDKKELRALIEKFQAKAL
ncbi:MAG: BatD family protein [Sulfurimonas sp.]